MKFFSYKNIHLGEFTAHQFTLFEWKRLCSIIIYWFCGNGWQGRSHSHAFNAWSFLLWGNYFERVGNAVLNRDRKRLLFYPRSCFHELGISKGCLTLLFAGPWAKTWQEIKDGRIRTYSWGRTVVS